MDKFDVPTPQTIKDHRLAYDLTREQAANLVHCTCHSWQSWEQGRRKMPVGLWELFKIKLVQYGG